VTGLTEQVPTSLSNNIEDTGHFIVRTIQNLEMMYPLYHKLYNGHYTDIFETRIVYYLSVELFHRIKAVNTITIVIVGTG